MPLERGAGSAYWLTETDPQTSLGPPLPSPDGQTVAYASVGQHALLDGSTTELDLGVPGISEVAWQPRPR